VLVLTVGYLSLPSPSIHAQGIITGSVSGTAVDPSGAVLPNANIVLTDDARGTSITSKAQADGNFAFRAVPIGTYTLTIAADGFQQLKVSGLIVSAGNDSAVGKQALHPGAATTVNVEGGSNVELDTSQSQVSASFDTQALERLPLAGGFDTVALLVPGVAQTHGANFSNTNGPGFSSNGERGRSNNFELDGQSNNDNSVGGPQIFFGNPDGVAEIQVIQSNFSAQYGRNLGSVVNYVTKSGTNSVHGSGFEFYTGSFLNSLPNQDKNPLFGFCPPGVSPSTGCAQPVVPRSVDNRWGGTLGAPIIKDKLWGFGSTFFEHTNLGGAPVNSGSATSPTPAGLQQLARDFPGNPAVATLTNFGPYGTTFGNPQPFGAVTTNPVTLPNGSTDLIPVSGVTRNAPQSGNLTDQEDLGRLDWQATSKDRFYLRYFYQSNTTVNLEDTSDDFYTVPDVNHSIGADWTHTFSSRWLDQLRYSFQQSKLDFQSGSFPTCNVTSLTLCPGELSFQGNFVGFGQATNLPQGRTVKVTQVQDNASWTHGNQTILFGGEYDRQNSPNVFLPSYNGAGLFSDLDTYIHQSGTFTLATGNPVIPFVENDYALYIQDDWKVTPNLTLNLGLRWEYYGQAVNLLNSETVARESNPATALFDPALPLSLRTVPKTQNNYKNFGPRVGFSYNPSFDKKLVIRGGYSIGYDPSFYNIFLNIAEGAPVAVTSTFACNGTCLGGGDFTGAGLRATNLASLPLGGNPGFTDQDTVPTSFHNPYAQTYSLGIEQQITNRVLGSLRYVGNHTSGLFQAVNANPDLFQVQQAFPGAAPGTLCSTPGAPGFSPFDPVNNPNPTVARPNCNFSNVASVGNTAFSIYNSLQSGLTFRDFAGFTGTVNYTYSRTIDNTSEIFSTFGGGNTISTAQNPLDTNVGERGVSGVSYPNVFSAGLTYKFPDLTRGASFLRRAVNGFSLNNIAQYNSGQPYTAFQPVLSGFGLDPSYCDNSYNLAFTGGGDSCRLVVSNPKAPLNSVAIINGGAGPYELSSFLNTNNPTPINLSNAHFVINNTDIANQLGNPYPGSGRNILRGPSFLGYDASIFKDTKLTERVNLQLQFSGYNVLNHQYLGAPNANAFADNASATVNPFLSTAYNGSAVSAPGAPFAPRAFTLGAKVQF
jgi:hypothetical protein